MIGVWRCVVLTGLYLRCTAQYSIVPYVHFGVPGWGTLGTIAVQLCVSFTSFPTAALLKTVGNRGEVLPGR